MDNSAIIRQVWKDFEPLLAAGGFELVEVEIGGAGAALILRLFIDKEGGGISLDDCAEASRMLNAALEDSDFFTGHYMLEVSSPGIDRPVRKPEDFVRFSGETMRMQTHAPVAGKKRFKGTLEGFEDGHVRLTCEGETVLIALDKIKRAHLERML